MMNVEKILETIKENDYSVVAIRHCCPDEEYKIGDICRNSFEWNEEYECSSYDTEEPEEMDGVCGYAMFELIDTDDAEEAKEIIERAIEESSIYDGNNIVIIGGDSYSYGNDENEVIVEEAEVIGIE